MPNEKTKRRAGRLLGVVLAGLCAQAGLAGDPHVDGKWHARFDAQLQGIHAMLLKNGDVLLLFTTRPGTKARRDWAAGNPDAVILDMDYDKHPDQAGYAEPKVWEALQMNEIEPSDPLDSGGYGCPDNGSLEALEYNFFCSGTAQMADGKLLFVGGTSDPKNPAIDVFGTPACCEAGSNGPKVDGINLTALFDPGLAQSPNDPWDETIDDLWVDPADPVDPVDRWYPTLTSLGRGKVFVTAGRTDDCQSTLADYPAVFDPSALGSQWTHYTNIPEARFTDLPPSTPQPSYPFMFLRTTGELFYAGQRSAAYRRTRVFHENGDKKWAELPDWGNPDKRSKIRTSSAATYFRLIGGNPKQFVLKAGGDPDNDVRFGNAAERIELTASDPIWARTTNDMTDLKGRDDFDLVPLPTGGLLAMGGHEANDHGKLDDIVANPSIYTLDLYDHGTNTWSLLNAKAWEPEGPNPPEDQKRRYSRRYHSASLLLPDGRILVSGGEYVHPKTVECPAANECIDDPQGWDEVLCSDGTNQRCKYRQQTAQIYSPRYLFNSDDTERQPPNQRPEIATAPSVLRYGEPFTITYNGTHTFHPTKGVCLVRLGAATHGFDHATRYVPLTFTASGFGTLTVSMPPSWNILPMGHYMLFIVSDDGGALVPSKAQIVKVDDPL